jgi:hypothetical protein
MVLSEPLTLLFELLFALVFFNIIRAQAPDTLWTKTLGGSGVDYGSSVRETSDEGYIITGTTSSYGAGDADIWLIKVDASGDTLWTATFGGSNYDWGYSVQQTMDGGYVIAGLTTSFGAGGEDAWLIKTNTSGDTLWTKTFGGTDDDLAKSVQQTSDGGYIITGRTWSYGSGWSDVWLIKTDNFGDTLWTKTFGGNYQDEGLFIQQASDAGYIITGWTDSYAASGPNHADVWIIRTDNMGDTLWTKILGGDYEDGGYSIRQTSNGGYIVTGSTHSYGEGSWDVWLICIAPDSSMVKIENSPIFTTHSFSLFQNYPNPFNPETTIGFSIPKISEVTLKIYNILGEEIGTIVNKEKPAGSYKLVFDASQLSSGIYFYQLQTDDFIETKKMILMR